MSLLSILISTGVGSTLGVFLAISINQILLQISINAFLNIYFGVLFIGIGTLLLYRINQKNPTINLNMNSS
jgi:hypothetical protein